MRKARTALAVSIAALSFNCYAATAATAGWMVNGTSLTGTAALASTATADSIFRLKVGGLLNIECINTSIKFTFPEIVAPNRLAIKASELTQCSLPAGGNCQVAGSKINVGSLLGEATLEGTSAVKVVFKPEKGNGLFSWEITGALCPIEGVDELGGQATMLAPTGQTEQTSQLFKWATTTGEIKPEPTNVEGSELLKLASGQAWSFL